MDRRHLEYFLAIVEQQGFINAAHALHVAQPSLSQAIKTLERELGVDLFTRLPRGVRLTPAGEALVGAARQTLRDFESVKAAVLEVEGLQGGRLDLVSPPSMSADPLADIIGRFRCRYPRVSVRILSAPSTDVLDVVRSGQTELALTWAAMSRSNLSVIELASSEVFLALPPGSDTTTEQVPVSILEDIDLIVGSDTRLMLLELLSPFGVTPRRIVVDTAHRESVTELVLAGAGAALLPSKVAANASLCGAVVCKLDPSLTRRMALVHRKSSLSAAARAFVDVATCPAEPTVAASPPCVSCDP